MSLYQGEKEEVVLPLTAVSTTCVCSPTGVAGFLINTSLLVSEMTMLDLLGGSCFDVDLFLAYESEKRWGKASG